MAPYKEGAEPNNHLVEGAMRLNRRWGALVSNKGQITFTNAGLWMDPAINTATLVITPKKGRLLSQAPNTCPRIRAEADQTIVSWRKP